MSDFKKWTTLILALVFTLLLSFAPLCIFSLCFNDVTGATTESKGVEQYNYITRSLAKRAFEKGEDQVLIMPNHTLYTRDDGIDSFGATHINVFKRMPDDQEDEYIDTFGFSVKDELKPTVKLSELK